MSNQLPPSPLDEPTRWLMRKEPWLRLLVRLEWGHRFQDKVAVSDIVQGVFLEAWRNWDGFRGHDEAGRIAWLRGILAHQLARVARAYLGTRKRDIRRERSLDQALEASSSRLRNLPAADQPSPSGAAWAREREFLIAEALSRLPDEYREVIILRNLEELPHREVALRMGKSEGAVRMLWMRALACFREQCEKLGLGGEP